MTSSNFEAPKGPFPANDNFQELEADRSALDRINLSPFHGDFSTLVGAKHGCEPGNLPLMVSGPGASDRFANWTRKDKIGRRKVTRSLSLKQVKDIESGWHHARQIGMPFNRFITIRPRDINDQAPDRRILTWSGWRNKLAQFARDNDFDFTCLWTRESQRETGLNEHMHLLMHVPRPLLPRFDKVVKRWCNGTDEIDVRNCSYQTRSNTKGGQSNVITYITKNSPQAGRFLNRTIQLGGPIFGKRYGLSGNLTVRARARAEVRGGLRRDLRLPSAPGLLNAPSPPSPANDRGLPKNRRSAA
jgi:hypothetical protein